MVIGQNTTKFCLAASSDCSMLHRSRVTFTVRLRTCHAKKRSKSADSIAATLNKRRVGERWAGADVTTASSLTRPSDGRSAARSEAVSQNQRRRSAGTSHESFLSCRQTLRFFLLSPSVQKGRKAAQSFFFRRLVHLRNSALRIARRVQFLFCPFFFYDRACFRFVSEK